METINKERMNGLRDNPQIVSVKLEYPGEKDVLSIFKENAHIIKSNM
jgi:hypothetical protein